MPSPELRKRKRKSARAADSAGTAESERGIHRKLPRRQAKASAADTPTAPGLIHQQQHQQQPTTNDVILGRGVLHVTRVGNAKYYELLDAYMEAFQAAPTKGGKTTIVRTIYQELSRRGVRFLKKVPPGKADADGAFCVIDAKQAKKKISHAIRYRKQNQQELQEMQEKQQQQQQEEEQQTLLQEEDQDESGSGSGGSATGYQGEDSDGGSHHEEEDREGDDEGGSSPDDDEGGTSSQDDAAEDYDSSAPPPPPQSSFSPWNCKRNGSSATSSSCDADVIVPQRRRGRGGRAHSPKRAPPYSSSFISPSHMQPQASFSSTNNTSSQPEKFTGFSLPGDSSSTGGGGGGLGSNASTASAAAAAAAAVDSLLRVRDEDPYSFPPLDAIVPYMNTMASWSAPSASSS